MTAIASISQDTASTAYASVNKSSGSGNGSGYAGSYEQREAEAKTGGAAASQAPVDSRPSTGTVNLRGKLLTLRPLDVSSLEPIHVSQLPEERYHSFVEGSERYIEMTTRMLESKYRVEPQRPDLSNDPGNKPYAAVVLPGSKVAATIDYEAMKSDPMYERLQNMLEQLEQTKQMRAEYLAQQQSGVDSAA